MLASVLILVVSLVLFAYWFRYTCVLLLNARTQEDYAPRIAAANGLSFLEVHGQLQAKPSTVLLDSLHRSLDRAYGILRYLLEPAAGLTTGLAKRRRPLRDYALLRTWLRMVG